MGEPQLAFCLSELTADCANLPCSECQYRETPSRGPIEVPGTALDNRPSSQPDVAFSQERMSVVATPYVATLPTRNSSSRSWILSNRRAFRRNVARLAEASSPFARIPVGLPLHWQSRSPDSTGVSMGRPLWSGLPGSISSGGLDWTTDQGVVIGGLGPTLPRRQAPLFGHHRTHREAPGRLGGEPRILDRIGPLGLWGGYDHGCRVAMNCDGAR